VLVKTVGKKFKKISPGISILLVIEKAGLLVLAFLSPVAQFYDLRN